MLASIATDKRGYPHTVIFFLFLDENISCGYSLEAPRRVPQHMFLLRHKKNISIFWMKKVPYLLLHVCAASYCIYPKYWDTLSTYHTGPKILNSPFYYIVSLDVSKILLYVW